MSLQVFNKYISNKGKYQLSVSSDFYSKWENSIQINAHNINNNNIATIVLNLLGQILIKSHQSLHFRHLGFTKQRQKSLQAKWSIDETMLKEQFETQQKNETYFKKNDYI